ncbi:hypothetical protein ACFY1L_46470 [Streptomyces sp. NPDC001663]|uniref:hypothetical protein n=1 Tax=Streptomyces sp. NPDC001663 TaxID=3364597 RepID=UPI003694836A
MQTVTVLHDAEHPGIEDITWDQLVQWLDNIGKALADEVGSKWSSSVGDTTKFLRDLTADSNVQKAVRAALLHRTGRGQPSHLPAPVAQLTRRPAPVRPRTPGRSQKPLSQPEGHPPGPLSPFQAEASTCAGSPGGRKAVMAKRLVASAATAPGTSTSPARPTSPNSLSP